MYAGISREEQSEYSWEGETELDLGPTGLKSGSTWASSKLYTLGESLSPSESVSSFKIRDNWGHREAGNWSFCLSLLSLDPGIQ